MDHPLNTEMTILQEKLDQVFPDHGPILLCTATFHCSHCTVNPGCYTPKQAPFVYIESVSIQRRREVVLESHVHHCNLGPRADSVPDIGAHYFFYRRNDENTLLDKTYLFIPAERAIELGSIEDIIPFCFSSTRTLSLNFSLTGRI